MDGAIRRIRAALDVEFGKQLIGGNHDWRCRQTGRRVVESDFDRTRETVLAESVHADGGTGFERKAHA